MVVKVAINGFGRVGRSLVRACSGCEDIDIVAVNSRAKPDILVHLLKYDSVHGKFRADVSLDGDAMVIDGRRIAITTVTSNLADLPWAKLGVEMVFESTGKFRKRDEMSGHLTAGAKKVILAAPGKGVDGTFVMGVNEEQYNPGKHHIVSNASCTTNCLAPVAKVLNDEFKIVKGFITTAHAYTMDQRLLDGSHKDLRRARAAAVSIVPTSTGAAQAVGQVIPGPEGKARWRSAPGSRAQCVSRRPCGGGVAARYGERGEWGDEGGVGRQAEGHHALLRGRTRFRRFYEQPLFGNL